MYADCSKVGGFSLIVAIIRDVCHSNHFNSNIKSGSGFNLIIIILVFIFCVENEIDGTGFFDLDESDIKSMVSKLGIVKKISRLQKSVSILLLILKVPSMNVIYHSLYSFLQDQLILIWHHLHLRFFLHQICLSHLALLIIHLHEVLEVSDLLTLNMIQYLLHHLPP